MGATAMIAGTVLSTGAKLYAGSRQKDAMDTAASQLDQEAGQTVAAGIQRADTERRKSSYVQSNARAKIAAGGLTPTGTSAQRTLGSIAGQGDYNALSSIYSGEEGAEGLNFRAGEMRQEGSAAEKAGWMSGITTMFTGGQSWQTKYGSA